MYVSHIHELLNVGLCQLRKNTVLKCGELNEVILHLIAMYDDMVDMLLVRYA